MTGIEPLETRVLLAFTPTSGFTLAGDGFTSVDSIAADRREEIELGVEPELETVVDPQAFDRIVSNLVLNALRHGMAPVRVTAEQHDRHFRLTVEDEGGGVAPEFRARLFDRFARDTSAGERDGTGLGLSIARQYATAHGGSIVYEDGERAGARFRVVLPAPRETVNA